MDVLQFLKGRTRLTTSARRCHSTAPMRSAIEALIQEELGEPSSEALIAHALAGQTVQWSVEVHQGALAERLRCAGDMEGCREVVTLAVENHPGHSGLLEAEMNLLPAVPIGWRDVMLPSSEQPQQQSA